MPDEFSAGRSPTVTHPPILPHATPAASLDALVAKFARYPEPYSQANPPPPAIVLWCYRRAVLAICDAIAEAASHVRHDDETAKAAWRGETSDGPPAWPDGLVAAGDEAAAAQEHLAELRAAVEADARQRHLKLRLQRKYRDSPA